MFPIRDDNPQILIPYGTYAIIALNVLSWLFVQGLGAPSALAWSVCTLGLIPGELLQLAPAGTGVPLGPGSVCALGSDPLWLTPVTSMFLHGGWLHIIGNMWFLWIFGGNVEDAMGSARFLFFYLLCGLAAAALQVATDPDSVVPMVGASGAIGGVMGAYVLLYPHVRVHLLVFFGFFVTTFAVPAAIMLGYWFALQLLSGAATGAGGGGVAFWAHVGGFLAGALLVFVFRRRALLMRHPYYGWSKRRRPPSPWHRIDR